MAESLLELSSKKLAKGKISDALSSDIASDVVKEAVTHEELIKKIEGLKFHIEPDLIHIDGIEEITNVHEITNENSFPIIFRVKVTHKNIFRVNPTNGIIGAKKTLMLKITRLGVAPRSDRFDVEALPYIEELLHLRKSTIRVALQDKVQWFFSFGYIPIVCSIRYKQIVSWDSMFSALEDNEVLRISSRLSKICTETEITSKPKVVHIFYKN